MLELYGAILFSLNRVRWNYLSSGRLEGVKTAEKFKLSVQKVAAYERWSPTNYSDFTEKIW